MNPRAGSKQTDSSTSENEDQPTCTLYVCTSCRTSRTPREPKANRQGFILYQELRDAVKSSLLQERVDVKPAGCLSICPRPCGIALSLPGAWTYLFGDQQPMKTTAEIIECVSLYLQTPQGFMARGDRPKSLRRSILGRVPPMQGGSKCT